MQKPFSAAVDLYRVLENMTDDVITSVLKSEPQEILAFKTCPACFGPRPANLSDYPLPTRDQLIFCLDGNFQHRHHSWDYRPLQTPHIFLQPSEFTDLGFPQVRTTVASTLCLILHRRLMLSRSGHGILSGRSNAAINAGGCHAESWWRC